MDKLVAIIKAMNLPYAYDHFVEGNSPEPPFLVYLLPRTNHFKSDGKIYYKVNVVQLEVYSDKKDLQLEKQIEHVLDSHEIVYEKSEIWIASERLYEVMYIFEMEE